MDEVPVLVSDLTAWVDTLTAVRNQQEALDIAEGYRKLAARPTISPIVKELNRALGQILVYVESAQEEPDES